jgi:hypothetical protein
LPQFRAVPARPNGLCRAHCWPSFLPPRQNQGPKNAPA